MLRLLRAEVDGDTTSPCRPITRIIRVLLRHLSQFRGLLPAMMGRTRARHHRRGILRLRRRLVVQLLIVFISPLHTSRTNYKTSNLIPQTTSIHPSPACIGPFPRRHSTRLFTLMPNPTSCSLPLHFAYKTIAQFFMPNPNQTPRTYSPS